MPRKGVRLMPDSFFRLRTLTYRAGQDIHPAEGNHAARVGSAPENVRHYNSLSFLATPAHPITYYSAFPTHITTLRGNLHRHPLCHSPCHQATMCDSDCLNVRLLVSLRTGTERAKPLVIRPYQVQADRDRCQTPLHPSRHGSATTLHHHRQIETPWTPR